MDHQVGMLLWWAIGLPAVAALGWLAWSYLRAQTSDSVDRIPQQEDKPKQPGADP